MAKKKPKPAPKDEREKPPAFKRARGRLLVRSNNDRTYLSAGRWFYVPKGTVGEITDLYINVEDDPDPERVTRTLDSLTVSWHVAVSKKSGKKMIVVKDFVEVAVGLSEVEFAYFYDEDYKTDILAQAREMEKAKKKKKSDPEEEIPF